MSKYWNDFYANRDRDNIDNIKKVDVKQLIRGVVVKKQTTTNNNLVDNIKRIFSEK